MEVEVEAVRDDRDLVSRYAFLHQFHCTGAGVCDDDVRAGVRGALQGEKAPWLVGVHATAVADPDADAG
jgi:hypothetical protein